MKRITKVVVAVFAVMAFATMAFATNPFADVDKTSYAWSAVEQLAAKGLIVGYEDGTVRGNQPATRFEVAAMIARIDLAKADQKDLEVIKKLCVEFKTELEALGKRIDVTNRRVDRLVGMNDWKLSGSFSFDANMVSGDNKSRGTSAWTDDRGSDNWTKDKARLYLGKQIDDKTYFNSEFRFGAWAGRENSRKYDLLSSKGKGELDNFSVYQFYVGTQFPVFKGVDAKIGRFEVDYEASNDSVTDNAPLFGKFAIDGFEFSKVWNKLKVNGLIGRNSSLDYRNYEFIKSYSAYTYALNARYDFNEKLMFAPTFYYQKADGDNSGSIKTLGLHLKYLPTPNVAVRGTYYTQRYGDTPKGIYDTGATASKTQRAWKASLTFDQALLKYTSLHFEWCGFDNMFSGNTGAGIQYGYNAYSAFDTYNQPGILWNKPENNNRSNLFLVKADQRFKRFPKIRTFERFAMVDFGTNGVKDANEWVVGADYFMSPAITFTLAFERINYGNGNTHVGSAGKTLNGHDNCMRFNSTIRF